MLGFGALASTSFPKKTYNLHMAVSTCTDESCVVVIILQFDVGAGV